MYLELATGCAVVEADTSLRESPLRIRQVPLTEEHLELGNDASKEDPGTFSSATQVRTSNLNTK